MYVEIQKFTRWLRCKSPHSSTHCHYTSDLKLFFTWANKPPAVIIVSDVDAYIAHCQSRGHAVATINRRLAALSAFYRFLQTHTDEPSSNPVIPRRHFVIKPGRRLTPVNIFRIWNGFVGRGIIKVEFSPTRGLALVQDNLLSGRQLT